MIEALRVLQKLDLELDELKDEVIIQVEKEAELNQSFASAKAAYDEVQNRMDALIKEKSDTEAQLELEELRLRKSRTRLNEIKSNFEYQALRREVEGTERSNHHLKETIDQKIKAIAELNAELEAKKSELDAHLKSLEIVRGDVQDHSIDAPKWKDIQEQRIAQEAKVEKALLSKYAFIRRRHRRAVVSAEKGVCQGCFMNLPPQMFNRMRQEGLFQCPHCNRILFLETSD